VIGRTGWKLERRVDVGADLQLLVLLVAIVASLLTTAALMGVAGASVREGFVALWQGAFGTQKALIASLVKATPLILTGLATVAAFRARVWNIGQEGQLYSGAMAGYWAYLAFQNQPRPVLIGAILVAALAGGAICGLLAAVIRARFQVDVIITTIMLNYIVTYAMSWLLSGPWRDPTSYYQHTPAVAEVAQFAPLIPGSRLHLGFVLGLVAALVLYLLLHETPLGYEVRAFGLNPVAARFQGTNVTMILLVVMVISGGVSGLAGASELFGIHHRLKSDISLGYGYTGIIIGMLAGLHPLAVIPAAVLFGGLINGAFMLQITTNVPAALVNVIQAVVLLYLLAARAAVSYRLRRVRDA
jgi:simple sugar transport system permease protein